MEYTIIKPWKRTAEFNRKLENFVLSEVNHRPIMVGHRGSGVTYSKE